MVHYIRHGRGDPLFLIHGLPKFGYTRQKNVPVLAEKFDVSVPEVTTYAEDLLALANHHIQGVKLWRAKIGRTNIQIWKAKCIQNSWTIPPPFLVGQS